MTGEVGEIIKETKPSRVLLAERHVVYSILRIFEFCDLHDVCFEEMLEQAEAKFLEQVDPQGSAGPKEGPLNGLPTMQERRRDD